MVKTVIELRWAGERSGVCDPRTKDHVHRRQSRAGTPHGEAWLGPLGFGSGVVSALAMADRHRGLEGASGVGGFGPDGQAALDPVARLDAVENSLPSSRAQGQRLAR
jgi:hypothetical protein